jgi:hypothetical protein
LTGSLLVVRYENRGARAGGVVESGSDDQEFELEVDWIKALHGGGEPDFVLVSRALGNQAGKTEDEELVKAMEYKRRGEESLRLSGLGYTIIRPGGQQGRRGGYNSDKFP